MSRELQKACLKGRGRGERGRGGEGGREGGGVDVGEEENVGRVKERGVNGLRVPRG